MDYMIEQGFVVEQAKNTARYLQQQYFVRVNFMKLKPLTTTLTNLTTLFWS